MAATLSKSVIPLSSIAHRLAERVGAVAGIASRGLSALERRLRVSSDGPADPNVARLFELPFDLMAVTSFDGVMLRVNPGMERVLGLAPEEVVGRQLFEIVHPDDREATASAFAGVLESGELAGFENRLGVADGSYRWLQWNALADAGDGLVYGVARNITERRHAEQERREAQRELETSRDDLRVLADEQASLRRVATLVAAGAASADVLAAIAREVAQMLRPRLVQIYRWERDGSVTVAGTWGDGPNPFPAGSTWAWDDPSLVAMREHMRTGQPVRIEDVAESIAGEPVDAGVGVGVGSAAGAPIVVDGEAWGHIGVAMAKGVPLPDRIEERLAEITELVATAINSSTNREQLVRLADEQAALRRVATLVAHQSTPAEIFRAVAEEVTQLLGTEAVGMLRFEPDGTATQIAQSATTWDTVPPGTRFTLEGENVVASVFRTGKPARLDD
jgi:PAS domain S-box-containing protein